MARITVKTIVPNYPRAFTQDVDEALAKARVTADETNVSQVVFEGAAYCWYGFMSLEVWQSVNNDELCEIQVVEPRELEKAKKRAVIDKINKLQLSMAQLEEIEAFLESI